jgi:hypothetical protein
MYQYGETVITQTKEVARVVRGGELTPFKKTLATTVCRNYAHSVAAQFPHGSLFIVRPVPFSSSNDVPRFKTRPRFCVGTRHRERSGRY